MPKSSTRSAPAKSPGAITSRSNPWLRRLRRAAARKAEVEGGLALAESPHLLDEALRSGVEIARVFVSERASAAVMARIPPHRRIPVHAVSERLFREISTTYRNQGVIALVRLPAATPETVFAGLTVALDGLQDPGNTGAIARSAEAFGASGLVFLKGSAAPSNPKSLRAAAGSLFRLPFLRAVTPEAFLADAQRFGKTVFAAAARGGVPPREAGLSERSALVIGSETHGASPALLAAAQPIVVPTLGVESLNAATAASVILYEAAREGLKP